MESSSSVHCIHEEEDEDAYIEINLDQSPVEEQRRMRKKKKKDGDEVEFRVSFLEGAALPTFVSLSSPPPPPSSVACLPPGRRKPPSFGPVDPRRNMGDDGDRCQHSARTETDSKELLLSTSRKGSCRRAEEGGSESGLGGGIMSVMLKFRYFMSFQWKAWRIRSQHLPSSSSSPTTSGSAGSSSRGFQINPASSKPILARQKQSPPHRQQGMSDVPAADKSRSSVLLLQGLGVKLRELVAPDSHHAKCGGAMPSKSCPASVKSTPLHHHHHQWATSAASSFTGKVAYTRDNSVQAAIAHCNRSSGRSQDFTL
ncbi:unnamed protein product [Cuscuta epithymum]|uniref:Uncharacterized protein n=1 Tax=Cuscuta epithymum TaxID=186058 RepID=A0AAV0EVV6_9ASTE|nr:unnamed protein product [Cuscuta epithymum]